jgi:hypothetical protein
MRWLLNYLLTASDWKPRGHQGQWAASTYMFAALRVCFLAFALYLVGKAVL